MTSFPDTCWCKSKEQLNNVLHDLGDGWEGWVQYISAWGEVSEDIVENAPCYVEWCIEQAKKFQNLHSEQSFTFNGDYKRCKAAMNVIIYPPEPK